MTKARAAKATEGFLQVVGSLLGRMRIMETPKGPRTQIIGFQGLNAINIIVFGP